MHQDGADGAGVPNPVIAGGQTISDAGGERKSRFTVKAVPKEESHIPPGLGGGLIVPGTSVAVDRDTALSKAQLLSKVEQLFEMNMRMVKLIQDQVKEGDDDHAEKNPPERQRSFTANDAGSVSSSAYIPNQSSSASSSSSGPTSSSSSSSSSSGGGYGKLFHYINEMKKELELSQSKNGESRLEMQRLRERNQQLADQLSLEQNRNATLEERLERARRDEDKLRRRIAKLEAEQQIPRTQEATATAAAAAAAAVTAVGSVGVVSSTMATGGDPDSKSVSAVESIDRSSRDESEPRGADSGHSSLDVSVALALSNFTASAPAIPAAAAIPAAVPPASIIPPSSWAVAGGRALPSAPSMSAPLKPRSRSGSCSEERKDGPASAPQPIPLPIPLAHPSASAPVERDPLGEIASRFF